MQAKITDLFDNKPQTFSFEFFPPKTEKGKANFLAAAEAFTTYGADFFSVTYGAGGTEAHATLSTVAELRDRLNVPVMHHLTCIKHTFEEVRQQLQQMKAEGIRNIMALRGDPPAEDPDFIPGPDQPQYAYHLIEEIRKHDDWFAIGAAGFPEVHPLAPSPDKDSEYLKLKQDAGADFAVTQLFFENQMYFDFMERTDRAGVTMRRIPGIFIVTDYNKAVRFCNMCGATVPQELTDAYAPYLDDQEGMFKLGVERAIRQCQDLLEGGSPGLHFYSINRTEPALTVYREVAGV